MVREDMMELIGLAALLIGAGLLFYGLYLMATWLMFLVAGALLMMAGLYAVYQANRGSE
jgi:hypothetical protein